MLDIKVFMRYNLIDKKEKETMLFVDGLSVYARYLHGGGRDCVRRAFLR